MHTRFPFPAYPRGWYVVALSSELGPEQLKTVHYLGQDIVLFRTAAGTLSALDKTCPHLGAHLGGGRVSGECLRCPFHDWAFDAHGKCVDVPYAPKIPPKAAARPWTVREQNGVVLVWFCPKGEAPSWEPPLLDEAGWTPNRGIRWELASHPQEIGENTVDCAHLAPVHHVTKTTVVSVEQREHSMRVVLHLVATGAVIQMADEINDVELDVTLHGLGHLVSNTHVITAGLRTRQRIYPTPIDGERIAIFGVANTLEMPDPEYTREIDEIFWNAFTTDFAKDFPIWENKAYLERPLLAGGDGPIIKYRRWARQFYDLPAQEDTAPVHAAAPSVLGRLTHWLRRLGRRPPNGLGTSTPADDHETSSLPTPDLAPAGCEAPAGPRAFSSVDGYFQQLEARFDASAAGDMQAVYQWVLTGQAPRAHYAEIKDGQIRAAEGRHTAPTVTIEMSSEDYLLMINGELNGARAFSTGRGKLRGPIRLAMKMKRLFPLERVIH